jgi:hypothetical protein
MSGPYPLPFLDKMVVDEHVGKVDAAERSLAAVEFA